MDSELEQSIRIIVGVVLAIWLIAIEVENRYRYRAFRKRKEKSNDR